MLQMITFGIWKTFSNRTNMEDGIFLFPFPFSFSSKNVTPPPPLFWMLQMVTWIFLFELEIYDTINSKDLITIVCFLARDASNGYILCFK